MGGGFEADAFCWTEVYISGDQQLHSIAAQLFAKLGKQVLLNSVQVYEVSTNCSVLSLFLDQFACTTTIMPPVEALSAFGVGSIAFWAFFHRGEHFLYPVRYMQLLAVTILASTVFLSSSTNITSKEALVVSLRLAGLFLAGVYSNCLIYRLFLNPLNSIPGPYFARVSKFNHAFRNTSLNAHHKLFEMHEKYGKLVRVGPNDISVSDADGVEVISGAKSKCTKGPWYGVETEAMSLQTTRDRAFHDRRRRVWAPAFSDKALRGYETRVQTYNDLLISKLAESKGMVPQGA